MAKIKFTKKYIKRIVIIVILLVVAFGIFFVVKNKDAIWGKVTDHTTLYTQEQVDKEKDKAYNEGYNDAHTNNVELNKQIEQCLKVIEQDKETIAQHEMAIADRDNKIKENQTTISNKEAEIVRLQNEQNNSNINHAEEIAELQNQISSLQLQNQSLQANNTTNLENIIELNNQITILENQITLLTQQIQANENKVAEYEANKEAWLNSIAYYESFLQALETETQAVAIFEVNGSVYKAQIVTKGASAVVTNPEDTETYSFAGWYVDDTLVENISTYSINTNTKFVAKFISEFNVSFLVDNEIYATTKVSKNGFAILENIPTKDGYEFDGFTINGVDTVDYENYPITADTIFIAKFTKLHTVTFIANDEVITTQKVRNGECTGNNIDVTNWLEEENYVLNSVSLNGTNITDYTNKTIIADITFVLNISKVHTVTFISNNEVVATQKVKDGEYAKEIDGFTKGWRLNDEKVDLTKNKVTENITLIANTEVTSVHYINTKLYSYEGRDVWHIGSSTYYSSEARHYIFSRQTQTWSAKTWKGLSSFNGRNIWTIGENYYYSNGSEQYVLNKATSTWTVKEWNGLLSFNGMYVWNDGENYYYSNNSEQYVLNQETNTWVIKAWNGLTSFIGSNVWNDGENYYYSMKSEHYILNQATSTWVIKVWDGLSNIEFNGSNIWEDEINIYLMFGSQRYILNKEKGTWVKREVFSSVTVYGSWVWTDGYDFYIADGSRNNIFKY